MSDSCPRINPRHRSTDFARLAAACLDLSPDVDLDDDDLELGAQIYARVVASVEKSAPEEKSA